MKKIKSIWALVFLALISIPGVTLAVDNDNIAKPLADFVYCYAGKLFKLMIEVAGLGTAVMIIFGGFMYITSAGDPAKVKKGTSAMTAAVVGFLITALSFAIMYLIGTKLNPGFSWPFDLRC